MSSALSCPRGICLLCLCALQTGLGGPISQSDLGNRTVQGLRVTSEVPVHLPSLCLGALFFLWSLLPEAREVAWSPQA